MLRGPCISKNTLVVFPTRNTIFHRKICSTNLPNQGGFPRPPYALWPTLEQIATPFREFIFHEIEWFYHPQPYHRVFIRVNLSKDLKEFVLIEIGNRVHYQLVQYIDFPNTCFCYQKSWIIASVIDRL
jgi:hypothetical protein